MKDPAAPSRLEALLLAVSPVLLTVLAYSPSLTGPFVRDDHSLIEEQAIVHELSAWPRYFTSFFWSDPLGDLSQAFYRPLTTLSFAIDWALWDGSPNGFHLTNVLLHAATVALVWWAARRLGVSTLASSGAALLFGLLPRLSESVSWISGRTDLLATAFALLAVIASSFSWRGRGPLVAVTVALGLAAKEVAVAAAVAILLDAWLSVREVPGRFRAFAAASWPVALGLLGYGLARTAAVLSDSGATPMGTLSVGAGGRLLLAVQALGTYVLMLLDPLRPRLQIGEVGVPEGLPIAVGLLTLGALVTPAVFGRRWRLPLGALLGLAFASTGLVLVLHVVPLPVDVVAADRYLYLPCAGLAIALAAGLEPWIERFPRRFAVAVIAIAAVFGAALVPAQARWADELELWAAAVAQGGDDGVRPHVGLAEVLLDLDRPEEAFAEYRRAIDADLAREAQGRPAQRARLRVEGNLALCEGLLGRPGEGALLLQHLVDREPRHARYRYNLARLRAQDGDFAGALDALKSFPPDDAVAKGLRELIASTRDGLQALSQAGRHGREPADAAARAALYDGLGHVFAARAAFRQAVENPRCTVDIAHKAAGYFALKGTLPEGEQALARFLALGGDPHDAEALRAVLLDRWRPFGKR